MLSLEPYRVPPGNRRSTRYHVPVVRVCTRLFAFVIDFVLHLGPLRVFSFANYTRTTADQYVTSPNTAQHRQGNQLRTSSSWHYQIASCTNLFALFTFFSTNLPCASVAGAVSRPRSGALVTLLHAY